MQHFTSYSCWGLFGIVLLVLVSMTYVAVDFFVVGQA